MLAVYTFVFSIIFKARWNVGSGDKAEFAMALFAGLTVYSVFSEVLNRAPTLIINNSNYVTKVVFPLEVLPLTTILNAVFHMLVSTVILLLFVFTVKHHVSWTVVLFPLVVLPLLFMTLGFAWLFSALGVYVRDMGQMIGVVTSALLFLSPVFYPITSMPTSVRWLFYFNPVTVPIEQARSVLLWGQWPDPLVGGGYLLVSLLVAWLGLLAFNRLRQGFADVL
jgi:lipopolysaccharide transport system permease protein